MMLKWCAAGAFANAVISMDDVEELCEVNSLAMLKTIFCEWKMGTLVAFPPAILEVEGEWKWPYCHRLSIVNQNRWNLSWKWWFIEPQELLEGYQLFPISFFKQAAMIALPGHVPGLTALGTMAQRLQQPQWQSTWQVIFELKTVLDWRPNTDIFNMSSTCKVFESSGTRMKQSEMERVFRCGNLSRSWANGLELCKVNILAHLWVMENHCVSKGKRRLAKKKAPQQWEQRQPDNRHSHSLQHLWSSSPHTAHCPWWVFPWIMNASRTSSTTRVYSKHSEFWTSTNVVTMLQFHSFFISANLAQSSKLFGTAGRMPLAMSLAMQPVSNCLSARKSSLRWRCWTLSNISAHLSI